MLLVLLGLVCVGLGPYVWVRATARGHIYEVATAPSAPVALVLGAGLSAPGTPSRFLSTRLDVAKQLYDQGKVRAILVSGDNRVKNYDEPTAMRDYLVARGVPSSKVVRDFAGRDTYDSCARALRIFGQDRLLVISQGYHLPRAITTCQTMGIDADGVGDWTMQSISPGGWTNGEIREVLASIKTVVDFLTGRDPVLGPYEPGVDDALAQS